jgi:hypothetical protein
VSVATRALRFVVLVGIVNLFADLTYEGGRGVAGAFLEHLGASGAIVGLVAGGGEFAGYAIRSLAGTVADRTGLYWLDVWAGYLINMLCVPALALAGSWPAAAGLLVGERLGRGVRKPVMAAVLAEAGQTLGSGRVFGLNEALDQTGATLGPLVVALAFAHGGFRLGFGVLLVPALLTLAFLVPVTVAGQSFVPPRRLDAGEAVVDRPAFARYAVGGALIAAGYVDFALLAFYFVRAHVFGVAAISMLFAVAMAAGALAAPLLGRAFDRFGAPVVAIALLLTIAAVPLALSGHAAAACVGVALWGVGTAVQDALLLALVASVLSRHRRATGFGFYDLIFGAAWFAGSAIAGVLLDRSVVALAIFSVVLQLCAIPLLASPRQSPRARRTR